MRILYIVLAIALFSVGALAQGHGTAPLFFPPRNYTKPWGENDYYIYCTSHLYPLSYSGDVWTGMVTAVHGREISLFWTGKKGKTKTFTGEVVSSYDVPSMHFSKVKGVWLYSSMQAIFVDPPSPSLVGKKLMVYYIKRTKKLKVVGKTIKVTTNYIFRLDLK